ncbi:PDGF/VEGF domain [Trinorchestia longiramus]|nr:PDGF/VEGF domain [Trinorchestia longiramus]
MCCVQIIPNKFIKKNLRKFFEMVWKCVLIVCVFEVLCGTSVVMEDQMVPGIRTSVVSPHYERRRPVRVPVSNTRNPVPINFTPHGSNHDHERRVGPFQPPVTRRASDSGLSSFRRNIDVNDRTLPVTPGDRLRPARLGEDASLPLEMNMEEMNMEAMLTMSKVTTVEEFARLMGIELPQPSVPHPAFSTSFGARGPVPGFAPRFGTLNEGVSVPRSAGCEPENQTVTLKLESQLNVMFFPTCVRLPRCGGCCHGTLLTCRPTEAKPIKLKILRTEHQMPRGRAANDDMLEGRSRRRRPRPGNSRGRREATSSYVLVEEEEHTACSCQCRVQEQDCNPLTHDYVHSDCQCVCKNQDERKKCEEKNLTHFWDNEDCACYCHSNEYCSTGYFFDHDSCSCSGMPMWGRSGADVSPRLNGLAHGPAARGPVVFDSTWRANNDGSHLLGRNGRTRT